VSILLGPRVVMESGMRTVDHVPLAPAPLARPSPASSTGAVRQMPPAVSRFIEVLRKADDAHVSSGVVR